MNGDVEAFARSESSLPVGFVVFRNTTPVGFAALKQESIPSHKHLTPWAAAAFVVPECRGQGIGAFMLRSVVAHAKKIIPLHTSFLVNGINDLRATFWASISASALWPFHTNQALSAALRAVASGPRDLCVMECKKMGFPNVYSGTSTARSLLQQENWLTVENVLHAGKPLTIFRSAA